ncbi:RNA-directed DNA polymerase, eukaryota, reverse transcriptase zinc-binding domain protein [Tanacetum coccineum]|uniref:RNA-directed DNA polymerase, eukaryota, reverse transcriptase zinc-binding domain protein n=1 Tax=Tanacetum coccineum TaxID=301880 RepID=A0ABQ5FGG5_9ASTR
MLYCVVTEEQYNLAYFFIKRIECARANPTANLPYGMFLTRLYRHIMKVYPHLDNGIYDIVDRFMRPLALKQTRRPRSDHGKARHSVSSLSSHHHGTSSHQHHDDDDDVKTSREIFGMHAVIRKALQIGLFKGALIGERGFLMSHLMYADDVIFMGGLKSKLLRVGVDHEESSELASILGCGVPVLPFTYLGVHVGCNMSRLANWKDVVDTFKHKLSTWNSCTLSRKMTLVAWKKCLDSKELGGLGVGSIFALNKALMFKWIWRLRVTSEDLWTKDIKNIYGDSGCVREASFPSFVSSHWIAILKATKHLEKTALILFPCVKERVYALDDTKSCTVAEHLRILDWLLTFRKPPRVDDELLQYTALRACTSQIWSHGVSVGFLVVSARGFIDDVILDVDVVATRRTRLFPAKVNVFFWRLKLNRIPTRVNLDMRSIDIGSVRDVETSNDLFFSCEMAVDLWVLVARWWELDIPVMSSVLEWVAWIDSARLPSKVKNCLYAVALMLMWSI